VKYLTVEQVLFIHDQAIKRFGGPFGVRELNLLESAVMRPRASFGGKDLYKGIFDKAGALLQSLLKNHPFVDGNKRTALSSAALMLWMNGYKLKNKGKKEVEFAVRVDNEKLPVEEIAGWLKKNVEGE